MNSKILNCYRKRLDLVLGLHFQCKLFKLDINTVIMLVIIFVSSKRFTANQALKHPWIQQQGASQQREVRQREARQVDSEQGYALEGHFVEGHFVEGHFVQGHFMLGDPVTDAVQGNDVQGDDVQGNDMQGDVVQSEKGKKKKVRFQLDAEHGTDMRESNPQCPQSKLSSIFVICKIV